MVMFDSLYWYHVNVEKIRKYKLFSDGCAWCGWDLHKEILQFHHRKPEGKRSKISGHFLQRKDWKIIQKEIDKCDLVCPNCHFWWHYLEAKRRWIKQNDEN